MSNTLIPGPDGFLPDAGDPFLAEQLRLSDFLFAEEQRESARAPFDLAIWRKIPKRQLAAQVQAVLRRVEWLDQHDRELDTAHLARTRLIGLLRALYKFKIPYTEPELCSLLDSTSRLLKRMAPEGPVERVMEYIKDNDLTPELCGSLRTFQTNLKEEASGSQASLQSIRQCLHVLLWLDEWEPLDPKRCWSECIRRDFRGFTGERKANWRRLLKHIRGNAPVRMPASWTRDAQERLNAVGLEDFASQVELWFSPFRSGQPLPLSVAGSHVLKGLIWYSAIPEDARMKDVCLWLLEANWKQKRNTEKTFVALSVFGVTKEELQERKLIKPDLPAQHFKLLEKLANATCHIGVNQRQPDLENGVRVVQGQLHFYRLDTATGRIERAEDNTEIELDWHSLPDQFRLHIQRDCSSREQVNLRAWLLMYDSIFGKYFVPKRSS